MEKIVSKDNRQVKYAAKLAESSRFRREEGMFFLEGARLCADAWESGIEIFQFFATPQSIKKYEKLAAPCAAAAHKSYEITQEVSARLSDTQTPQGIFCICKMLDKPPRWNTIKDKGFYLALENVQDPANLGASARTGEALGIDGILVSGGCDRYNTKALRASMGALFRLPLMETDNLPEAICFAGKIGLKTLACVPERSALSISRIDFSSGAVAVIGNEGAGLTADTISACNYKTTIPMRGRAESLNASMAAGIVLWEMLRPREE